VIASALLAGALLLGSVAAPPEVADPSYTHRPAASDDDRAWAVQRPSRSVSVVRSAATVPARWRAFARCVLARESGATLERPQSGAGARNPSSSASGRWQFLQGSWGRSLPYMVRDQLVQHGMPKAQARKVRVYLQSIPISRWPGLYQDMGFIEVVERGGSHHWRLAGSACEAYR
jgi:hypothetical protein